jgi:hypothetical protein
MLNRIERFRAIVNELFLDRGTVRRGGQRGSILKFVKFAYDPPASLREALRAGPKNMLLHIFRLEAKASRSGRRKERVAQEPQD